MDEEPWNRRRMLAGSGRGQEGGISVLRMDTLRTRCSLFVRKLRYPGMCETTA